MGGPVRVLAVDDEPALLEIAKEYLESIWGFEVSVRESGGEALEALRDLSFDAVVSDYEMPGMNGIQLLDRVRGSGSSIPFIMLTGKGREEVVVGAFRKGCDDYIQKGGDPRSQFAALAQSINNCVDGERAREALHRSNERFVLASEATEDGIFDYDRTSGEMFATARFKRIMGVPEEETVTLDGWRSMVNADEADWVFNEIDRQFEVDGRYTVEYRLDTRDGRGIRVRDRAKAVTVDDTGAALRIVGSLTDITDQRGLGMRFEGHEQLLDRSLSNVPDMISIHDRDMNLLYCNWNGEADVPKGRRRLGDKCHRVLHGRDEICEGCHAVDVIESGHEHYCCKMVDGGVHDVRIVPLFGSGERVEGFVNHIRDLTELHRALGEERSARETMQTLMDGIPDIIDIQDPEQGVIMFNRAGFERFGIGPEDLDGRRCYEFLGRDGPCEVCATAMAKETRRLVRLRKGIPELGGVFECASNPVYDDQGTLVNVIEQLRDVTSEERMISEMRGSERRYDNLFRYIEDGIILHDDEGRILDINDRMVEMSGIPREGLIGSNLVDLFGNRYGAGVVIEEVMTKGHHSMSSELIAADGSRIPVEVKASIANPEEGTIHGFVRDVSERHRNERALLMANRKLNLLSSVTRHDVLNNITALSGYTRLIRDAPEGRRDRYLTRIEDIIDGMTRQLRFTGEYQDTGLNEPAWQSLRETVAAAYEGTSADVSMDLDDWELKADPLLEKVFLNLFDNSVRHNDGAVSIRVTATLKDDELLVTVEDDGRGVPMEEKSLIFERDYGHNTGFGLFLCQEILMVTGMSISEEGGFGNGARFVIRVPKGLYRERR